MDTPEKKKRIFSGIQPSGKLTLGNYLGAVKNWADMQDAYDCIYCIVDLHAITLHQDPAALRKQTYEAFAQVIACGIDPEKSILFIQSHVHEHTELSWILGCNTMFGELSRMTQFKDKAAKHPENINAGLFTYPVLMVSDILLYQTDLVPVGEDQRQHLELTRNVAQRVNSAYGNTFTVPDIYTPKVGAKIMSLTDPTQKMSKSDPNPASYILLSDSTDDILRKFKRAVTDSDACVRYHEDKPGVSNLMTIYSAVTGKSYEEIEREFDGKGYGVFKPAVGEAVDALLRPARERTNQLLEDREYLEGLFNLGAARASQLAQRTLDKVCKKVGFIKKR